MVRLVYVAATHAKAREDSEAGITHHMDTFLAAGSYLGDLTEKKGED